jgi:predicted PurR-regulated permease PerM
MRPGRLLPTAPERLSLKPRAERIHVPNKAIRDRANHPGVEGLPIGAFVGRLLIILVIGAIAAALWRLSDILVLLFGAILLAIGLHAATRAVARLTGMRQALALATVVFTLLVALGAAFWVFGTMAARQLDDVIQIAPAGFRLFMDRIAGDPIGRQLLDQVRGLNVADATGWATSVVSATAGTVARGLGYTVIGLFVAIYIAAQPLRYRRLCLRLVPPSHRTTLDHLFDVAGETLRRWFIGQLVVMATIGLLTGVGLWLLGIEAAFALGLMGGLLCFVPFVGAILAAVPATLVALTQGPLYAASVIAMYAGVHFIEGNFITPLVQAEATALPPVLAILSTLAFSLLFGPAGVLLAAPLTLFFIVTVEILYVQKSLGEPPETPDHRTSSDSDGARSQL